MTYFSNPALGQTWTNRAPRQSNPELWVDVPGNIRLFISSTTVPIIRLHNKINKICIFTALLLPFTINESFLARKRPTVQQYIHSGLYHRQQLPCLKCNMLAMHRETELKQLAVIKRNRVRIKKII